MAVSGDVKLLSMWASPFAVRAMIALNIKSVEYELHEEILTSKSDLLLESNPVHKKLPVLIHAGKPVSESLVIVQYIDETWSSSGHPILPSDPYDRALARFWGAYVDDKCYASLREIIEAKEEQARKEAICKAEEGIKLLEKALMECSKGKAFFNGDRIGYTDIALGCLLAWMKVVEQRIGQKLLDEIKTPVLCEWAERFCDDPVVKPVMPDVDKLSEFAEILFPKPASLA
ncbi:PREDICTED: glutathione S-transferase U17-like [Tarenaya hassleriana]|uniref:glutathione S-transferase U17-like n=1 Tax=Tarenaya hassleriana TaxID=28532 RepID=UPI00053C9ABB|nr:PREDICTED: glutathione S-transferase U17-like [Tarenaya hassleriana]